MKEDEIGEACSTHGIDEKCIQYFVQDIPEDKRPEDLDIDGRIHLTQDRTQWRALVNTVMNLLVS
jgi:hypothetical protein